MAKKKLTQKSDDTQHQKPQDQKPLNQSEVKTLARQPSMEDASEKLQNLKNLNSMLLKETIERRQQVESLNQAKEGLQNELSRFSVEKTELVGKVVEESEKNVSLEIEKGLFSVFVETQMREMSGLIETDRSVRDNVIMVLRSEVSVLKDDLEDQRNLTCDALRESGFIKSSRDQQTQELLDLLGKLSLMEEKEREIKDEILTLKKVNETLMKEKNERDRDVEAVEREKVCVERRLVESEKEIDGLKGKIEGIAREKKEIEMEKSWQREKINDLEKEVRKLNEIVLEFQKEEKVLRGKVLELEKSYNEAMEKEKEMALEINALAGQKREKQSSIERLMEENVEVSQRLEMAVVELNDKAVKIEKLLREKNEIMETKVGQESVIVELHKEISELRDVVITLKESCMGEEEKNKRLLNEVRDYKNALDQVMLEKDDAQMGLVEEKKNGMYLSTKVLEMEKRIEDKVEELTKIRDEFDTLIEEKNKMVSRSLLLMKEKELAEKNLSEVKQVADDLRTKLESVGINSDRALSMLKKTAAMVCQSKNDLDGKREVLANDVKLENGTELYVAELVAIENAFRNKEKVVEEIKQQVEFMKKSVTEAQKKKSFWTVVSSATTFLAAASVAYAARVR